ncbi:MAG: PD-(D/E)XK nuclease family protein [Thermoplasmata archaeon]|nr:PD-(D/E)XK nuclease family protein [Thermoplasmata archaeon]
MLRCKSIDELYEEVQEFDLVITVDAALATALNARIDKAFIGHFAMTPKQIAGHIASRIINKPLYSELKLISTVSDETGMNLKYVHSELENIKEIRKYTKDVRKHLHSASSKRVYDSFEPLPTLERVMGSFVPDDDEFYRKEKVAVIGVDLFNDLDKHFIPIDYEPISLFTDEEYEIDRIYEVGNDRQLAENAVELIDPANPSDYAVVVNVTSPLTDALRSSLYRKGIPFINSLNVRDLSQIRDYLRFITLSLDFETLRVKHVKELFSNYNGGFFKGREEFLLCRQTDSDMTPRAVELWNVMKNIFSMTFSEVCEAICNKRTKVQVNNLINELNIADRTITSNLLNEVRYAVDNVKELTHNEEIPENERNGALIVDCKNSIYIDRPVVIYLGMEQDWNISVVGKPYIDVEDETDKNVMRLSCLIQQGDSRYYLVNPTKGGKPARPCILFDLVFKRPVDRFGLMCNELVKGRWHSDTESMIPDRVPVADIDRDAFSGPFSKSSFNSYFNCPMMFLFNKVLTTPDEKDSEFGTLIHSFAEFYVCYPEDVRTLGVDHFVDLISDKYSGLSSPLMEGLDKDRIRKAMKAIIEYLDFIGVKEFPLDTEVSSKDHPNRIMQLMGKKYTSSLCERELVSEKYPVYGQLDLTWMGVITDYKTGNAKTCKDIADAMTFESKVKFHEFQAPIYLALMKEDEMTKGRFNLFYAMDHDVTSSVGDVSIGENVRSVVLREGSLKDVITRSSHTRAFLEANMSKNLRSHARAILDIIAEIASDDPADWSGDEGLITNILSIAGLSDCKTNRKTVVAGINKIANLGKGGLVVTEQCVEVPETTLETIMARISEMHKEMRAQSIEGFPAAPKVVCEECRYYQVCTREIIVPEEVDYDE